MLSPSPPPPPMSVTIITCQFTQSGAIQIRGFDYQIRDTGISPAKQKAQRQPSSGGGASANGESLSSLNDTPSQSLTPVTEGGGEDQRSSSVTSSSSNSDRNSSSSEISNSSSGGDGGAAELATAAVPMTAAAVPMASAQERLVKLYVLGQGGGGRVWKALDLSCMRIVALKEMMVYDDAKRRQVGFGTTAHKYLFYLSVQVPVPMSGKVANRV